MKILPNTSLAKVNVVLAFQDILTEPHAKISALKLACNHVKKLERGTQPSSLSHGMLALEKPKKSTYHVLARP
jgi:hypothetical protein